MRRIGVGAAACVLGMAAAARAGTVGSWAAAQQRVEDRNRPPVPLAQATLRQVVRLTAGGPSVVVHFSNAFGNGPLTIAAAHVATPAGPGRIDPATDRPLTFAGGPGATLPPGTEVLSDPLPVAVAPRSDLAVTIRFADVPADLTGHPGSRATSYLSAGDDLAAAELPAAVATAHWYVLSGVDVPADHPASVVIVGDSITDGRGSTTDGDDRWPDDLAARLSGVGVLNAGIGGNRLTADGLGPSALARFDRDVAAAAGARWVLILEGVNDLGTDAGADRVIAAYAQLVARGRRLGLRVYGATILPFGGAAYDTPGREADRQRVNDWIRTPGHVDAAVDLDAAARDPDHPARLRPDCDAGDHLHPNPAGYHRLADAVDLNLFPH